MKATKVLHNDQPFDVILRTTKKYRRAFAHLDSYRDVGSAKLIMSRKSMIHDYVLSIYEFKPCVDILVDSELLSALMDTITECCGCEHDCCAHPMVTPIRGRILKNGLVAILTIHTLNV